MPRRSAQLSPAAVLAAALVALAAGCAALPAPVAYPVAKAAPPPTLLPIGDLLAQAALPQAAADPGGALAARAARLRARAALMRGPVTDTTTRARLAEAIARGRA
ncbi:MAG: hypothetical protein KBF78_15980 [Fuscovulum sp.]|jgi:hypothetical protein|nr:hypothetical protein [Fuscovulum sp.]